MNDTDNYFTMSITMVATTSRGSVTINSTDASDNPVVNIGWLSTSTDQEVAIAGLKRARQLANVTGIAIKEIAPGPAVQSDSDILQYIKSEVRPIHHAASSCKWAPEFVLF
jgi:choline dehydrogenase